jgi:peptidyl-prolyl cis-trans isomerase SurA
MDALQPGEGSAPIESPFGWDLIQVLERRDQDVTQERQKLLARQAIRERKAEEAFQDWVRQIRDSAYVELRPLD